MTNDTNILPIDDEILETPLVSSTDDTLTDPNLLLFQESQFSTAPTVHSAVRSVTPTSHSKENSNHNKHDLKEEWIEQLNAELKALKSFIREELYVMKKMIEDLQGQKATPNHSVVSYSVFKGRTDISKERKFDQNPGNEYNYRKPTSSIYFDNTKLIKY